MESNKEQYKCRSPKLKRFLENNGFEAWDRAKDWNTNKPFWYFKFDNKGRLSKCLTIWTLNKKDKH